jgi:hypothetical protein
MGRTCRKYKLDREFHSGNVSRKENLGDTYRWEDNSKMDLKRIWSDGADIFMFLKDETSGGLFEQGSKPASDMK